MIDSLVDEELHNALFMFVILSSSSGLNSFLLVRIVRRHVQSFTISKFKEPVFTCSFSLYGFRDNITNFVFFPSISNPILFVYSTSDVNTSTTS